MKLVLIGIQGAGKSTQGNLLSRQFDIPYLSTGHIFREIAKEKTNIGRYIKETINAGILIPDEKTIPIVNEYLSRREYQKGYILDGFPRTLYQAKEFKNNVDKVIYLDIPDKEALWRLAYRNDSLRGDNTVAAITRRIELFHKVTRPVINYYKREGKLVVINGLKSIKEVNREILKSLGKQLVENKIRAWELREKIILAIVGLPGSGKTEASAHFAQKKLPIVQFGKIVNDYIDKHKLEHIENHHKRAREDFRKKYGLEAFALLNKEKIKKAFEKNSIVVIDGMRSWEEYKYLKRVFPKVRLVIIGLYADKHIRYRRLSQRVDRNKLKGDARDVHELIGTNMGPTIAYADFMIDNNATLAEFKNKLESVYRTVYFS
ncbi:MAG TPA: nucleoside monophosphate kinase [Patescibacteria group bacterium]|nr:nucleoside monophosphate kinase [Patescibacteria group bacterium]